jgi:hypothetical protein
MTAALTTKAAVHFKIFNLARYVGASRITPHFFRKPATIIYNNSQFDNHTAGTSPSISVCGEAQNCFTRDPGTVRTSGHIWFFPLPSLRPLIFKRNKQPSASMPKSETDEWPSFALRSDSACYGMKSSSVAHSDT